MSLSSQLSDKFAHFHEAAPEEFKQPILAAKDHFEATFDLKKAIQVGDSLPSFRLTNALGEEVDSSQLLSQGPLLITFYRGSWCPFCDLAVASLQKHLDAFQARGVTLVAITPELPDFSLTLAEKHDLKFPVLTDRGNKYAGQLGLLFPMPDTLRPAFKLLDHSLEQHNGDDSFVLPVTATLLVDGQGVVRNTFVDPDYTKRLEPSVALEWIDELEKKGMGLM